MEGCLEGGRVINGLDRKNAVLVGEGSQLNGRVVVVEVVAIIDVMERYRSHGENVEVRGE